MKRYEKMSTDRLIKLRNEKDRKLKSLPVYMRKERAEVSRLLSLIINEIDYRASRIPLL